MNMRSGKEKNPYKDIKMERREDGRECPRKDAEIQIIEGFSIEEEGITVYRFPKEFHEWGRNNLQNFVRLAKEYHQSLGMEESDAFLLVACSFWVLKKTAHEKLQEEEIIEMILECTRLAKQSVSNFIRSKMKNRPC